jgi:DNA mismatch repair protein MutL
MPIQILPTEVASQIAAGEVVERPASVVKELIENSLDAGSHQIAIVIEAAGQKLVEISDDGKGISGEELSLAVARHATSKLQTVEDLQHIQTLGFRGEALASIGSVARLTIASRVPQAEIGWRLRVDGGISQPPQPIGVPTGTVVRVEDLFYNVPARRKFLKHETTERRYIDSLVTRYALAYPQVRIHLQQEGRTSIQTSGNGDRREVLAGLYGVEIAHQMLEVQFMEEKFQFSGFISPISLTRSNRQEIHFFINGRPVLDATLTSAVIKAYHTLLMVGRFPLSILFVGLPLDTVDVNVHPTKAEVRFINPGWVFSNVQRVVRRTLVAHTPVPEIDNVGIWGLPDRRNTFTDGRQILQGDQKPSSGPAYEPKEILSEVTFLTQEQPERRVPLLRLIGQIASTYLVAEGPDGLYLIDQHAAHERVLFEKYLAQRNSNIQSQSLLQPASISFTPAQARLVLDQLELLTKLGFQVEPFGPATFLVRAIPAFLTSLDAESALRVLVEDFEEDEIPLQAEIEQRIMARICKRAAVKAGKTLSLEEQRALLADLETCHTPRTCPHGRPTMIHLSVDLLERQFGRKGVR